MISMIYGLRRFNKSEEEFADKTEYDDYLEEREDISERLIQSGKILKN